MKLAIILMLLLVLTGCQRRTTEKIEPFQPESNEYVLAVVLDMSSSFGKYMQNDDPRAYKFFANMVDRFYRDRMGSDDRLIIAQLSTGNRPLLWDGRPGALKRAFPNKEAFADFLIANSEPKGSNVYAAIDDTLGYLMKRPGITADTTLVTVVISDLVDSDPNATESKAEMIDTLQRYRNRGGAIGFYWVEQTIINDWNDIIDEAGYPPVAWTTFVDQPPLPNFAR